mgnify:CR=1 FL=1
MTKASELIKSIRIAQRTAIDGLVYEVPIPADYLGILLDLAEKQVSVEEEKMLLLKESTLAELFESADSYDNEMFCPKDSHCEKHRRFTEAMQRLRSELKVQVVYRFGDEKQQGM